MYSVPNNLKCRAYFSDCTLHACSTLVATSCIKLCSCYSKDFTILHTGLIVLSPTRWR